MRCHCVCETRSPLWRAIWWVLGVPCGECLSVGVVRRLGAGVCVCVSGVMRGGAADGEGRRLVRVGVCVSREASVDVWKWVWGLWGGAGLGGSAMGGWSA